MSNLTTYKVLRSHEGDKFYSDGDTRELSAADAKHLVDLGVLKEIAEGEKMEGAPQNKAEKPAKNKEA